MADEFGLRIVNSGGETQIDGTYRNLLEYETGSVSCTSEPYTEANITDFAVADGVPIVCFKVDSTNMISPLGLTTSGSNWATAKFLCEVQGGTPWTMYWAAFRNMPTYSIPEFGLAIKNADDKIVFTSSEKPFRIVGTYTGSTTFSTVPTYGFTAVDITVEDADNNYFHLHPSSTLHGEHINVIYNYVRGISKKDSTTITLHYWYYLSATNACGNHVYHTGGWTDAYEIVEITRIT